MVNLGFWGFFKPCAQSALFLPGGSLGGEIITCIADSNPLYGLCLQACMPKTHTEFFKRSSPLVAAFFHYKRSPSAYANDKII